MENGPPPDCQPLHPYVWYRTNSLHMAILLNVLPWYNWESSRRVIRQEVLANSFVRLAPAKKGFWLKYTVQTSAQKLSVEIFIRTVELDC